MVALVAACSGNPTGQAQTSGSLSSTSPLQAGSPHLFNVALVYDQSRRQLLLVGSSQSDYKPEMWTWDGQRWVRDRATPGSVGSVAYDHSTSSTILLAQGTPPQTWELKQGTWVQRHPATELPSDYVFSIIGDAAAGNVVAFDGCCAQTLAPSQTWIWTGDDWVQRQPRTMPSNRVNVHLAYDAAIGHVVMFGGDVNSSGSGTNDLWVWDGSTWVAQHPRTVPPPDLANAEIGYDAAHKSIVLLFRSGKFDVETWTWDGKDWTRQYPSTQVSTRVAYSMAWDDATQQLVLFDQDCCPSSQTYVWTGTDWQWKA